MTERELTETDVKRIKDDIKLTLILGFLFTVVLIIIVFIIPTILILFKKPADGFMKRGLIIMGLLSLPLLGISWKNIVKYIDLRKGKKTNFETSDYEIKKEKDVSSCGQGHH